MNTLPISITRTLDPYSRLGTSYVLIYAGFGTADERTRRDLILAMDNIAASIGCPHEIRNEITLPAGALNTEFRRVVESIVDMGAVLDPLIIEDFEEALAIYHPALCLKHALAHRLWEIDPKNWGRLMGIILSHMTENEAACRRITESISECITGN